MFPVKRNREGEVSKCWISTVFKCDISGQPFYFHLPLAVTLVLGALLGDWSFAAVFSVEMHHRGVDQMWYTKWVEIIYPRLIHFFSLTNGSGRSRSDWKFAVVFV